MAAQGRSGRPAAKRTPAKKAQQSVKAVESEEVETPITGDFAVESVSPVSTNVTELKAEVEETPEQKRIRELEAKLEALLAAQATTTTVNEKPAAEEVKEGDKVLIHFIEDGHTAQGQVWYRGQELEFIVGSKAWEDTLDRNGDSWVLMSENDQADKWNTVKYRRGPWPGKKSYKDGEWSDPKNAPAESALQEADIKERERRQKGAPTLPNDLTQI